MRLGEKVLDSKFKRQMAELDVRASILNRFTELGRAPDGGGGITTSGF